MRRLVLLIMTVLVLSLTTTSLTAQSLASIDEVAQIGLPTITSWSPTGQYGVLVGNHALMIYDATYNRLVTFDIQEILLINYPQTRTMAWHSDERYLAVEFYLGQSSKVIVWDTRTWSDIFQLELTRYQQINWHPILPHLAIGGQVYDVQTGDLKFEHLARFVQFDRRTQEVLVEDNAILSDNTLFWNDDGTEYVSVSYADPDSSSIVYGIFKSTSHQLRVQLQAEHVERHPVFYWNDSGTILTDGVTSWDSATGMTLARVNRSLYRSIRTNYSAILGDPNNERIVTQMLGWDRDVLYTIYLWDARTGKLLAENAFSHPLSSLYANANRLTAYTGDGYRITLDSNDLSIIKAERVSPAISARTLAWSPDSTRLLTAGIGPALYPMQMWSRDALVNDSSPAPLWTVHDSWADYELQAQEHYITSAELSWLADSMGFTTSSSYFTILANTMRIDRYAATDGTLIEPLFYTSIPLYENSVLDVAEISPDLSRIARFPRTYGSSTTIEFADLTTGQTIARLGVDSAILMGRWNPQGTLFAGGDNTMQIWRVGDDSTQLLHHLWVGTTDMAWSPDGTKLALVRSGQIAVFDALSGETLMNWEIDAPYKTIAWYENDTLAITYGDVLEIWNIADNTLLATFSLEFPVNDLAWSPDGQIIALASRDGTLRILQLNTD